MSRRTNRYFFGAAFLAAFSCVSLTACSSGPDVKQEQYAQLRNQRTFEYEFPAVWNGIEEVVRNWKVTDRDPKKVTAVELKHLRRRTLETDWMYTRSTEKYVEYKVNDLPRKTYLQTRLRYKIDAQSVLGGVQVTVNMDQQIQRLRNDGSPDGWDTVEQPDGTIAAGFLDKLNLAILSAPNTSSPDDI